MFKSLNSPPTWRGILAAIIGIIALAWPGVSVLALVMLGAGIELRRSGKTLLSFGPGTPARKAA